MRIPKYCFKRSLVQNDELNINGHTSWDNILYILDEGDMKMK